jgi:hypothetical protein
MRRILLIVASMVGLLAAWTVRSGLDAQQRARPFDEEIRQHAARMIDEGRKIFRFDTFGDEAFWGDQLQLHRAVAGAKFGGVGPGLSPAKALELGLKVDAEMVPADVAAGIKAGKVDLNDPANTIVLLKANAVVGVTAFANADGSVRSMGIQCALCHSTVDDSFSKGIGRRLDGWPNRDLNVGAIVALAPNKKPLTDLIGVNEATLLKVLNSWGPGRYDAELDQDGKGFRPDGKSAATVLPAAFGLAGVNLHTYSGWGSVTYWNAYVAITQMHGKGTFYDPRLNDKKKFPIAARAGFHNIRNTPDLVTPKLAALHYYQLSIPAPKPADGSFDAAAAKRGEGLFNGTARCATCHVPPLFTEPGWSMHTGKEIGIDDFQSDRSPDERYRTTPLSGLFTRQKGGFYHDGRFATLEQVVSHYENVFKLALTDAQRRDLVEYLKSL